MPDLSYQGGDPYSGPRYYPPSSEQREQK
jgi:hypothetical protein